jgi:uncharacterized protein (TIGR03083 family)
MNITNLLDSGHGLVLAVIEGLPEADWQTPGVCGAWSTKDVLAHLIAYEWLVVDVLGSYLGGGPAPYLDAFKRDVFKPAGEDFNDLQVAQRKDRTVAEVLAEFHAAHKRVMALIRQIPPEVISRPGTLPWDGMEPWVGMEYALDDYIVHLPYGHKREHSAHIAAFRERRKRDASSGV